MRFTAVAGGARYHRNFRRSVREKPQCVLEAKPLMIVGWAHAVPGHLYMARIPEHAIRMLERVGLVTIPRTMKNGIRGMEYRFRPEARDYLARYFEEIPK